MLMSLSTTSLSIQNSTIIELSFYLSACTASVGVLKSIPSLLIWSHSAAAVLEFSCTHQHSWTKNQALGKCCQMLFLCVHHFQSWGWKPEEDRCMEGATNDNSTTGGQHIGECNWLTRPVSSFMLWIRSTSRLSVWKYKSRWWSWGCF